MQQHHPVAVEGTIQSEEGLIPPIEPDIRTAREASGQLSTLPPGLDGVDTDAQLLANSTFALCGC